MVNRLNGSFFVSVILQIHLKLLVSQLNIPKLLTFVYSVKVLEFVKTQLLSFQYTATAYFTRLSCIEYALEQVNFLVQRL